MQHIVETDNYLHFHKHQMHPGKVCAAGSLWELLGGGSVPDCRGSREITVLTDSQGKLSDRTNKERKRKQLRAEKGSGWSLDTRDVSV